MRVHCGVLYKVVTWPALHCRIMSAHAETVWVMVERRAGGTYAAAPGGANEWQGRESRQIMLALLQVL